jgi:hypothetical protein
LRQDFLSRCTLRSITFLQNFREYVFSSCHVTHFVIHPRQVKLG